MSTRALLHIGYPKSASTWLQTVFFPRVENASLVPKSTMIEAFMEPGALSFDADVARRRLRAAARGRMILSFEKRNITRRRTGNWPQSLTCRSSAPGARRAGLRRIRGIIPPIEFKADPGW